MYNIIVKRYQDVEEVRVFPLVIPEDRKAVDLAYEWEKYNQYTGEIFPLNVNTYLDGARFYDPFEEEISYFRYLRDKDESSMKRSMRRSKDKIKDIAYANRWDWFITLTFNPDKVDSFDYDLVVSKLSDWLSNNKKICRDMKYLVVPEQHPTSGRWHFHGLFAECDGLGFVDSGLKQNDLTIYNVGKYKLGFSTATEIVDTERASSYITKYICKDIMQSIYNKRRYWYSKNCNLPEVEKYFSTYQNVCKALGEVLYEKSIESPVGTIRVFRTKICTTNISLFRTNDDDNLFLD